MRLLIALTLAIFLPFHFAIAQTTSPPKPPLAVLKGTIGDSTEEKNLSGGVIMILQKSDSIIIGHTRSDKSGNFQLKNIPAGNYLLLVTYPAYADYVDELVIKDSLPHTLHPIGLVQKSKLLEAVVVNGSKGAIHMKGDTTEFRADSFHTQAGANVEELLKKLPGIQIDSKGQITAMGQTVKKVLVDGEEFFGDDPTLVTQNLRADMVDKVQVYDKKSEQSNFTGIDDGQRDKTINLKLKDSKKNGYFGKLSAGQGTDGYYDYQAMLNYFRKKEKLAAYGIISNTGKTGLNWQERDNYGQSQAGNFDYDEVNGYSYAGINNDFDSWDGRFDGQGLPSVKTGGLHYNNKWNDDKQTVNGNYKAMQLDVRNASTTNSKNILPDSFYFNNETSHSSDHIVRHSMDGSYEIKFDSTSTMKIMTNGGVDHKTTYSDFNSESLASDSSLVNRNTRNVSTTGDKRVVNSDLLWRKKFAKKGRTFSLNVRENFSNNTSDGILQSTTGYYDHGSLTRDSIVDQHKDYHSNDLLFDTKLTYTEPLSKVSYLIGTYSLSINNSHADRNSYNKAQDGKYSALDSLYSNDYQFNVLTNTAGLNYSLVTKKLRVAAGSGIGFTRFDQKDLHADTTAQRKFVNWYPNASMSYAFNPQKRLAFRYNGSMNQPNLNQLQPIRTNDDPLNIYVGNPALKPEFNNRFGLNFNEYKVLTERSIWVDISYNFTQNALSSSTNIDTTGKRTTQTINVDGNHSLNGWLGYDFKWRKPGLSIYIFSNFDVNSNASIINDLKNTTNSSNVTFGINLYKSKDKKYEASLRPSATYTQSTSSINTLAPTRYWTYTIHPDFDIFLPLKFQVHGDADINIRPKTAVFANNLNNTLLNAWLGKKFMKNDALLIKVSGNDLLNQNIGFNRSANSNFISQNTFTTIKRYYMLSVVWNFTKAGTPAPPNR